MGERLTVENKTVNVISAKPLTPAEVKKVERVFLQKHSNQKEKVIFDYQIDEKLIGGIMVIDGDKYYDGTISGKISKLAQSTLSSDTMSKVSQAAQMHHFSDDKTKPKKRRTVTLPEDIGSDGDEDAILKELKDNLKKSVKAFNSNYDPTYAGSVVFAADGVVHINGLSGARYGEMLTIADSLSAIVLSLEEDNVGAIVLDDDDKIAAHMVAKSTGMIVSVPVGNSLLGRVVNPLGLPIDGMGDIKVESVRPIEAKAPPIKDRGKVNSPLQTGILSIDSMIPIGKGQRELIIGDRQTGKTTIAIDTILNQKGKNVICVYVAIGQKASSVANLVKTLEDHDAMEYTVVVCATARDSAPLQYIAPYAGCAIAEEFMYAGKDVLIVYDDLSKHAVAYRAMSLLLKRPPGREAYPGDIFYLHSRLLERAAKLSEEKGGGSITALPIVETLAGDISAYIPTNIISITDGQIYLESDLFNAGMRPAINVGLSVSRVGSNAQKKIMSKISGKLRLDLSQYRELETFARFGSDIDDITASILAHGARATEVLKQEVHEALDIEHQIIILYITQKKLLNDIPVDKVNDFKHKFVKFFDMRYSDVIKYLSSAESISVSVGLQIEDAVDEFKQFYNIQNDFQKPVVSDDKPTRPIGIPTIETDEQGGQE